MKIDFEKSDGLIPAIVQDAKTAKVLMLGYMNKEALVKTEKEKRVTFYSRSKERLWTKGETSGNFLEVVSIKEDCDNDTLLIQANPAGTVCHKGSDTCFNESNFSNSLFLEHLEKTIQDRKVNPSAKSYTSSLLASGINKVAQKVGEEAVELVIEAKDNNKDLFIAEAADLLYHYIVLLTAKDITLADIIKELEERHK